jgi:hypothetical protein
MLEKAAQLDCRREMSIAAVALRRYRLRHQDWPPSLAALVPEFLSEVPRDWVNGEPLRYRRNNDGTFTLYSVGMDGQDDGGNPEPGQGTARSVFQGRDWVWAQPVSAVELEAARRREPRTLPRYPIRPVP